MQIRDEYQEFELRKLALNSALTFTSGASDIESLDLIEIAKQIENYLKGNSDD